MKIADDNVIQIIIKYSQYDIRRLIFILQDLYFTYSTNIISIDNVRKYLYFTKKKDIDITLFDATRNILDNYMGLSKCIELYETEKVLLPLMMYENYYRKLFVNNTYNNITLLEKLDISRKVCDSISNGDVIETNIYTDQNWTNQGIHGFYTICNTSYILNKTNDKVTNKQNKNYKVEFSSDLNKTSLKNINKKNHNTILHLIPNKNLDDIIYINKLIYTLIKKNKFKEAFILCKEYKFDVKSFEVIIKIDKTRDKIILTPTNRKLLCI